MTPVQLDLTRDLPKVREQYAKVLKAKRSGVCEYTAPCVVGAMVPPHRRKELQNLDLGDYGNTTIGFLIRKKAVTVPAGQSRDFARLQNSFDTKSTESFERTLANIERKYGVSA